MLALLNRFFRLELLYHCFVTVIILSTFLWAPQSESCLGTDVVLADFSGNEGGIFKSCEICIYSDI